MSRFDGADIQLREPVDEAAYLGATIDGAVLRTEHVDIQVCDTGTPVPLGSFRTHPAAVKCLGMNDVAIEILDEQAVVTRRQQRGADVPGKQNLRFRIIEIEVSGGMQVVRGNSPQAFPPDRNVRARIGDGDERIARTAEVWNEPGP